jgi:hypothetical protein
MQELLHTGWGDMRESCWLLVLAFCLQGINRAEKSRQLTVRSRSEEGGVSSEERALTTLRILCALCAPE